jgi:DNA-binding transcriptional LysR family regulator
MTDNRLRERNDIADPLAISFTTSYAGIVSFLAVADEGGFARAGDRLGIGRSSVSRNIQRLEAQLGVQLFVRTTRCTVLTREGALFYEHCRSGLGRIAQALQCVHALRDGSGRDRADIESPPQPCEYAGDVPDRACADDARHIARRAMSDTLEQQA